MKLNIDMKLKYKILVINKILFEGFIDIFGIISTIYECIIKN
jgi:hypothetical protein